MGTLVSFQIAVDDIDRARKFYSDLFDWEIARDDSPVEHWTVKSVDLKGSPGMRGGMMKRAHPDQTITAFIDVSSVDEHLEKIRNAGGKVLVDKEGVPGIGYFAVCLDTENNPFGIWQADTTATKVN